MKFNSRQLLCFLVIIFSVLLIGASSVCAQDTDTTDNITDDIGQNIIINENDLNIGENSTLENSITYGNNTATYTVNFGDTKMDICPMINGALNDNYTPIENFTYFGLYNGANFYLYIDHPIYDGNNTYVMLSITYMFSNLTSTGDIFSKLEKQDYGNSIMLTRTVHVNSIESYEDARINSVNKAFSADMITACFDIFDKKNAENVPLMFADNFGRTNCLSSLRKHDITFNYNVLFDNTYNFNSSNLWDLNELGYDSIHIDGNGSTICGCSKIYGFAVPVDSDKYQWANIGDNRLCVNNLIIKGFNSAIINRGICELDNVTLENALHFKNAYGAAIINLGHCTCANCNFLNNYAEKGGAIYNEGTLTVNNCIFVGNIAFYGGAIYNENILTVNDCIFDGKTEPWFYRNETIKAIIYKKDDPFKITIFSNGNSVYGGAIYNKGVNFNVKNSVFMNHKTRTGGAIWSDKSFTISNSEFLNNMAILSGGAIRSSGVNVVNCGFESNSAVMDWEYILSTSTIIDETGGGAISYNSSARIENCRFEKNYATDNGGAICDNGVSDDISFIGENKFVSNTADGQGGAIYATNILGNLEHIEFNKNAAKDGGAICISEEYDGIIRYCIFDSNTAISRGGAICVLSHFSDVNLTNNNFLKNTAALGNSGFTMNVGGLAGDAFILGPNYYGDTDECRKGQFYYETLIPSLTDLLPDTIFSSNQGYEQEIKIWYEDPLDVYSGNAKIDNNITFETVKTIVDQILETYQIFDIIAQEPLSHSVITIIDKSFDVLEPLEPEERITVAEIVEPIVSPIPIPIISIINVCTSSIFDWL